MIKRSIPLFAAGILSACSPTLDTQGQDPYAYMREHAKVNTAQPATTQLTASFLPGSVWLADEYRAEIANIVASYKPEAFRIVSVDLAQESARRSARERQTVRFLRSLGLRSDQIRVNVTDAVSKDDAFISFDYMVVQLPNCPDWHKSPVVNYSNTNMSNANCALATNAGVMVANPADFAGSKSYVAPSSAASAGILTLYDQGKMPVAPKSVMSGGGSSAPAQ